MDINLNNQHGLNNMVFFIICFQNSSWSLMEETNPELYAEAIACVAAEMCDKHVKCMEKGRNRYNTEKEMKETQRKKFLKKNNQ